MIHLPLSKREREALWSTLLDSHTIRTKVHVHNSSEKRISSFHFDRGSRLASGAVQVDSTADVVRSLNIEVLDRDHRLAFTPDSPAHGAVFADYFLSVEYSVYCPQPGLYPNPSVYPSSTLYPGDYQANTPGHWFDIPVFWGPLTHFSSSGPLISLEAQSKESLAMAPHYAMQGYGLAKQDHTDDAIKEVMRRMGERRFDIPSMPWRIGPHRVVHATSEPWKVINGGEDDAKGKKVAGLIERTGKHPHHCYYDAFGRLRIKRLNKEPVFTFDADTMLTQPQFGFDSLEFANTVEVRGAKPRGKGKKRAHAKVSLPRHHPLSPQSLARNGVDQEVTVFIDAPNLKTDRDCRQRAHHVLKHRSEIGIEASFDCLPIPMLEPLDYVRVETDTFPIRFALKQFTIPLTADQSMTIGSNRRQKTRTHRHDEHHHRNHGGRHHHHQRQRERQGAR